MVNNRNNNNNNNNQQQQAAGGGAGGGGDHVQNRRNAAANPPDGGAAVDWVQEDLERFSFDDSDRFEEDSLCSWSSEPESVYNNWRGWKKPSNFGLGNNNASAAGVAGGDNPTDVRGNNGSGEFVIYKFH